MSVGRSCRAHQVCADSVSSQSLRVPCWRTRYRSASIAVGLTSIVAHDRLLRVYQVDPDGTKQVLDMARAVGQALLSARASLQRGTAHFQQRLRDIEEQADTIRGFAPAAVFGVFQTEAYASLVFGQTVSGDVLAHSVAARLERQRQLLDAPVGSGRCSRRRAR